MRMKEFVSHFKRDIFKFHTNKIRNVWSCSQSTLRPKINMIEPQRGDLTTPNIQSR